MTQPHHAVLQWLLEGDPAIRWQVLRDLLDEPERVVAREQKRVASEGWGARLLSTQHPEGGWKGLYTPKWTSTTYTLLLLRQCGLPPRSPEARRGALLLLDKGLYRDNGINFWLPKMTYSETCVTGMVLGIAARFAAGDKRVDHLASNLLAEQMSDGGWNCRRQRGATHSSLHTTILALEGLLEYEDRGGSLTAQTAEARARGHEFLFRHQMFRSHRTGKTIDQKMTRFSFPPQWHYDVLRGMDYLRAADGPNDPRIAPAIELILHRRDQNGIWPLNNVYRGEYHFTMESQGRPSRWNTLRALRTLRWWEQSSGVKTAAAS